MFRNIPKRHWLLMLGMSLLYVVPMFWHGGIIAYDWQDTDFHMARVIGLAGIWQSPVSFLNFNHIGTIVNEFYPWLTIYPWYLLFKLTNSLLVSYVIYNFGLTLLTMLIARWAFLQLKDDQHQKGALLFALIYTWCGYRAVDLFTRGSLGELIALTFLPIILVAMTEILIGNYRRWYLLAVGMSLVVYSHVVSSFMLVIVLGLVLLTTLPWLKDRARRVLALAKAAGLTLLTTSFVYAPMLEQILTSDVYMPKNSRPLHGANPVRYLAEAGVNWLTGYTIGLVLLIAFVLILVKVKELKTAERYLLGLAVFLLVIMTTLFPWHLLDETIISQVLSKMQFVWRFNAIVSLLIAYLAAVVIEQMNFVMQKPMIWLSVLSACLVSVHFGSILVLEHHLGHKQLSDKRLMAIATDSPRYLDYRTEKSVKYKDTVDKHVVLLNGKKVKTDWQVKANKLTIHIKNNTSNPAKLDVPVFKFAGQRVQINGKSVHATSGVRGTTVFEVSAGNSVAVIRYDYTTVAKISGIVSALGIGVMILKRKRNEERIRH